MSQKKSFHDHMRAYQVIHQNPINKACHMIGVPMILVSLPLMPTVPPVGFSLFGLGWAIQFAGHYFEGKKPEFVSNPINLALGPVWVAIEWAELLTGKKLYTPPAEGHGEVANDVVAEPA
jgi:uncharacterized membrane protein YGL010W